MRRPQDVVADAAEDRADAERDRAPDHRGALRHGEAPQERGAHPVGQIGPSAARGRLLVTSSPQ